MSFSLFRPTHTHTYTHTHTDTHTHTYTRAHTHTHTDTTVAKGRSGRYCFLLLFFLSVNGGVCVYD